MRLNLTAELSQEDLREHVLSKSHALIFGTQQGEDILSNQVAADGRTHVEGAMLPGVQPRQNGGRARGGKTPCRVMRMVDRRPFRKTVQVRRRLASISVQRQIPRGGGVKQQDDDVRLPRRLKMKRRAHA